MPSVICKKNTIKNTFICTNIMSFKKDGCFIWVNYSFLCIVTSNSKILLLYNLGNHGKCSKDDKNSLIDYFSV